MSAMQLLYGCQDGMNTMALAIGIPLMNVVMVGLRFYTRRTQDTRYAFDDWASLGALVILIGMGVDLLIAAVRQVLACPAPENEVAILDSLGSVPSHIAWSFYVMGVVGVGAVKVAFLMCVRRILSTGEKGTNFSRFTWGIMSLIVMWTLGFIGAMVIININWGAPNQGAASAWASSPANFATTRMFYAMTVSDVIIDSTIMVLPAFVIFSLRLSPGRKAAIAGIFSLRLLALATSAVRMVYTIMFVRWMDELLTIDPTLADPDHLLVGANLNTQMIWWTMLEVGFGLFASCITTIQFLLRRRHVDHFINRGRVLLGMQPRVLPLPSPQGSRMQCCVQEPRPVHRSASKHGNLYRDDSSVLSVEYTVGSVPPSPLDVSRSGSMDSAAFIESRHGYVRKGSNASLSVTIEEKADADADSHDERIGRAV